MGFHKQVYLYPLSTDRCGVLKDLVIFPAFLLIIIILGAKPFRVCDSTLFWGMRGLGGKVLGVGNIVRALFSLY